MQNNQELAYTAGTRDTLLHMLERAVAKAHDQVFFDIQGDTCTYAELDRRATRFAHELAHLGVQKGDTVATMTETHADTFTMWFGITKLGAIWVPINLAYRHEFLRHQINDAAAKLVLCDNVYLERMVEIADRMPNVKRILCRGGDAVYPDCSIPIESFDDHRGTNETPIPITVSPADLAALMYTSGTTGPSKGCMLSHNYLTMQGRQARPYLDRAPEDITFTPLPMFHMAALTVVFRALHDATRFALWPRFSLSSFWDDIEQSGATQAVLMASIFSLVAKAPDTPAMHRCKGRLKMVQGVPISSEIRKIWQERFGVKVVSSWAYGQTENNRLAGTLPHEEPPESCAGRATDEFELMIFDENDCPVPPGTVGQIVCRPRHSNSMFEGYWNRPEATAAAWRNMWMHTGDLGKIDEHGWLYFVDRAKDYLRCRGENISSFEVEATFLAHSEVADAAVHAVSAQSGEDDLKATLVLSPDATLSARDLCLWSIERLPYFAVPRFIEFRAELPKNPTGKILKYQLRDEGVTEGTWDREEAGIVVRRTK